jgi:anti-sigma B factor antagonist
LNIETRDERAWHTIVVTGEVDLNSSPRLRKAILAGIDGADQIGVDLAGASYMDSSGVATLVEGLKSASEKKKKFAILQPSGAVMKVLKLARLDALFDIRASLSTP